MAALDFPASPTIGQKYPASPVAGIPVYTWDGQVWTTVGGAMGGKTPVYTDGSAPMAAQLTLIAPPVAATDAAAKSYVDARVRYDAAQGLTASQKAQGRANIDVLKKNYVINGAMMVSQENGATAGSANTYYPVDQFSMVFFNTTAVVSAAQVASRTPAGSPNRFRVTVTTADASLGAGDSAYIRQSFEGLRFADLGPGTAAAKTVTFQFGCKGPAGTYCAFMQNYTGGAPNRSYAAEFTIAAGEANTDVVKSITFQLDQAGTWPSDNGGGGYIGVALMAGSNAQTPAGVWAAGNFQGTANQFNFMGTAGNVFELFDVGLYEGAVAPAFQVPDYAATLYDCMRYWQMNWISVDASWSNASQVAAVAANYLVRMRATPTVVYTPGSQANCTTNPSAAPNYVNFQMINTAIGRAYWYGSFTCNARV